MNKQIKQALLFFVFVIAVSFANRQEPKKLTVSLYLDDWNFIINTIDDAPLEGKVRRAMIDELKKQLIPQLPKDSTKTKK